MLKAPIVTTTNNPIFRYLSLKRGTVLASWSRQLMIVLIGIFYSCAVLEVDLGETGDSFGGAYDTFVPGAVVQSPKSTETVYRVILPVYSIIDSFKNALDSFVDKSFLIALAPLALCVPKSPERRRLQVIHAIWRL